MLGKAGELKTTGCMRGTDYVEAFFKEHPDYIIMQVLLTTYEDIDYFYIIYKEEAI